MTENRVPARTVGVLALQGDFREHREVLERLGHAVREIRNRQNIPGATGSSLTIASSSLADNGNYEVVATSAAGSSHAPHRAGWAYEVMPISGRSFTDAP